MTTILRRVKTQMDELDENIAHRKFEDAVSSVGKLRVLAESLAKNNSLISELIHLKLDERASKLASKMADNLVENPAQKTSVKASIQWLVKLDYEGHAREAFLEARSATIKQRTR